MTDLVLSPAILGRSHALRTRVAGAVITLLAVLLVFAVAPANLRNLPAVGALARALEPGVAAADSYYNDEACDNNTVNWSLTEDGSNVIFDNQPCHTPIESQGWGIYDNLSWNGAGSGANGAQNYFSFYAPGGPTGQTTLSQFNSGPFVAAAEYGFGAGLMGDIGDGHGMLADNDPRNLAKGQSVPDNTVGQMADCWGYGNATTQVVNVDHSNTSGACQYQADSVSYNLTGQHYVGVGIGTQSRDCFDTADGGNCETGNSLVEFQTGSVQIDDPADGPSLSGVTVNGLPGGYYGQWLSYANDSGTISTSATAWDSGGVCNIQVTIAGPGGTVAAGGNNMGTLPAGFDSSTGDFSAPSGGTPAGCPNTNSAGTSGLSLAGLPSGTYTVAALAQNPGNVVGSGNTSATSSTFQVDNQVPSVTIDGGGDAGHWSSDTSETYSVSASEAQDLSGIASITCTGAGLPAGGQTFPGASAEITETEQGDDAISCHATTGAGVSGADGANVNSQVGTEGQTTDILIDTATPSVAVDNDSPASQANGLIGNWVDPATSATPETVDVYAAAGVSGIAGTTSRTGTIDQWSTGGSAITSGVSTEASLDNIQDGESVSSATIDGNTYGMPYCTVTDLSDPTTLGGADDVTYNAATGGNVGDGTNAPATPAIDADSKYVEWQIPFTQNGHYQLDCSITNGAGVTATLATQTIEVDQTNTTDLAQAAESASSTAGVAVDAIGGNSASPYVSPDSQSAAQWSGDPLTLTYTPAAATSDWPANANIDDSTEVDPIVKTVCTPGGDAGSEAPNTTVAVTADGPAPTETDANSLTIGQTTWEPQADNQPAAQTPADNGNDELTCTETNAAGTTSDPTTYYVNIDQQTPMVAYSQPPGDTGGQGNASSGSVTMTPAALAARTGLPEREFGLAPLASKIAASSSDPVPATGHLAPAGPAEFRLSPHASTTGVQYSDTATQVNATPSELSDLSGIYGEYCSDTNQTESGPGGNQPQPYGDGSVLGAGGTTATLDVPETGDATDAVTGIHSLDCYGQDSSWFTGSDAQGPFSGTGSATTHYPYASNQTQYDYTLNVDDVSPATIGWGIINQGETVTDPDPYAYDPGHWYQDEATLTATAQAVGNDLSDIDGVVCAVNDPTFGQPNSTYTNPVTGQQVPYYDYTLDGAAAEHPTDSNNDYTVEIPVSDDNGSGTYYVSCFAVSGSGVNGTVTTTEVNLQRSSSGSGGGGNGGGGCTQFCTGPADPDLVIPPSGIGPIPGGQEWHTTPQQVPVIAESPAGSAPIESITCAEPPVTLDGDSSNPDATDNGDGTITYPNPAGTNSNTESITVIVGPPPLGEAEPPVECYATDAAGVDHTLGSYQVNVDDTAPTGYFVRPNASNPRTVTLYATDNNGSGIANVIIQLVDSSGNITPLPLTSSITGDGDYTAELPPDNQMAKGSYTLQAIVTDNAGNVTNPPLDQWQDGTGTTIQYPVLGSARMIDALGPGTVAPLLPGDNGTTSTKVAKTKKVRLKVNGKWVTRTVPVYKTTHVTVHGKRVTKKLPVYLTVKATAQVQLADVSKPVKLTYGGASTADGIATTGAGVPIVGGTVQITATVNGAPTLLGTATTNGSGRWLYHVPAGPSRQLAFEYMGTPVIDTATGSAGAELVTGSITIKAPKSVKVGHQLVLTGKLPGGYIPSQGVPLRVYYTEKGAKGTGDYAATYHSNSKGAFTIKEPSRATARGHTYTFWVKVVTPSPWPYNGATSKKLTVKFT